MTEQRLKFVNEYFRTGSGTKAAIAAGYSERSAHAQACRLLKCADVREELTRLRAEAAARVQVDTDYLLSKFRAIAEADLKDFLEFRKVNRTIKIFLRSDIGEMNTAVIKRISQGPKGALKIELHDKENALIQLGRHIGFFNDELTIKTNLEKLLADAVAAGKIDEPTLQKVAEMILKIQKSKE